MEVVGEQKGAVRGACGKHCPTSQSDCSRRHDKEWCMGLGQVAREVWSRLGCDEFHRSGLIQLAKEEAVRSRVARVGEEGLEAATRVIELACNRATDDQRIVTHRWHGKTFSLKHKNISPQSPINSHHNRWTSAL